MSDRIADSLIAERDKIGKLGRVAKDTPDLWIVIGMVVQWLVEQFGSSYGISYETIMSWVNTISEITQTTDGGSMTVFSAIIIAASRLGYKYYRRS